MFPGSQMESSTTCYACFHSPIPKAHTLPSSSKAAGLSSSASLALVLAQWLISGFHSRLRSFDQHVTTSGSCFSSKANLAGPEPFWLLLFCIPSSTRNKQAKHHHFRYRRYQRTWLAAPMQTYSALQSESKARGRRHEVRVRGAG